MKVNLFIDSEIIGSFKPKIIDESMSVIGGLLEKTENYLNYEKRIQEQCLVKGVSNIDDLNYNLTIEENEIKTAGGIGVTDLIQFEEIEIEVCGVNKNIIDKIKNCP